MEYLYDIGYYDFPQSESVIIQDAIRLDRGKTDNKQD